MKLEGRQSRTVEPLEKVQKEIEARIDFEHRKKAVDEIVGKLLKQAAIPEQDQFITFCVQKLHKECNK